MAKNGVFTRIRKRPVAVVAAGALALTGVVLVSPAQAELNGSTFELDGNLVKASGIDWLTGSIATTPVTATMWDGVNLAGSVVKRDKATGTTDDSYQGGVKEDTICPGQTTGSIPNNKSDLKTFRVYVEPGNTAEHPGYLNIAWSRVAEPSGTTLMDFEFNQSTEACGGDSPNNKRTGGDLLIEYLIDQGGARIDITVREWVGDGTAGNWSAARALDVPSPDCGGNPCAEGAVNSAVIPANVSGELPPVDLAQYTFGEATIDLRTIFDDQKCTSFGSAMLKSRSSDSFTSQPKDFIAPEPISLTNCAKVIIRKETVNDAAGSFEFTPAFDTDPANSGDPFYLGDGESESFDNVLFGSGYSVTESTLADGFELESIDCTASTGVTPTEDEANATVTFAIDANTDIVDCTFTNKYMYGTLAVEKVVQNDYGNTRVAADFAFTVDGTEYDFTSAVPDSLTSDLWTQDYLDGTVVDVAEVLDATGQYVATFEVNGEPADDCLDLTIVAGETVTCTIINTDLPNAPDTPTTVQSWVLMDSFTMTGLRPVPAGQEVTDVQFVLYSDAACEVEVGQETVTGTLNAAGTTLTAATVDGVPVSDTGDYFWRAFWAGDAYNTSASSPCGAEVTQIFAKDALGDPDRNDLVVLP